MLWLQSFFSGRTLRLLDGGWALRLWLVSIGFTRAYGSAASGTAVAWGCHAAGQSCRAVWLQGCLAARLFGCKAALLQGCRTARLQGCTATWLQGCSARLHGCKAAQQGCMAARLHGCKAARLQGCKAARLHGCKAAWLSELKVLQIAALLVQLSCNS